jgi:hypothetical protein
MHFVDIILFLDTLNSSNLFHDENIFAFIFTIAKFPVFKCSNEQTYYSSLLDRSSSSAATEARIGQI